MAPTILRELVAAVAACSLASVMAQDPPCAIHGHGYNDPFRNDTPNGGFPNSSLTCQKLCANQVYCERFTFYNNTHGCWLQGDNDDTLIVSPYAISGPVRCPLVLDDKGGSGPSPLPWLIGLGVLVFMLACAAFAKYMYMCFSEKKKKEKKTSKVQEAATPDVEERAALVSAKEVAPASAVYYSPTVQAPMTYTVPAPAVAYVAPPRYVYQQTSSQQVMMPVAQPAQDLFDRFDTDGDGTISREELEAGMASLQR